MTKLPVLYSFRRCPYAIRARMAIAYADIPIEIREIDLKNKPAAMIACSPKATVPVLQLPDATVIEESLQIMRWCLEQYDPENWLLQQSDMASAAWQLIDQNDNEFKPKLDYYKYSARFPEQSEQQYRSAAEPFLQQLESLLQQNAYLLSTTPSIADIAIMPFIRQFAYVDMAWFSNSHYPKLQQWLQILLQCEQYTRVMRKYPLWQPETEPTLFP